MKQLRRFNKLNGHGETQYKAAKKYYKTLDKNGRSVLIGEMKDWNKRVKDGDPSAPKLK